MNCSLNTRITKSSKIPSYHRLVKTFPWSQPSNSKLAKKEVTDGGEAAADWRAGKPLGRRCRHLVHGVLCPILQGHAGSHAGLLPLCSPGAGSSSPPLCDLQPEARENQRRSHTCRGSICSALGAELHPRWKGPLPPTAFIRCQRPFIPDPSPVP